MELFITTHIPAAAAVLSGSLFFCCAGGDGLVIPDGREAVVTVIPADGSGRLLPSGCVIESADGCFRLRSGCKTARLIDWGAGRAELIAAFSAVPCPEGVPKQLDAIDFTSAAGEETRVTLFRDGGLRLAVSAGASERSYAVSGGTDGSLQLLDIGSERLLIVHASGCSGSVGKSGFYGLERNPFPPPREMLIALNGELEIIASVEGDKCLISDGYLTSVERLGTVLGHEKHVRRELSRRGLVIADEEIGFFSGPAKRPQTPDDTALALLECVLLRRKEEALSLLSDELAAEVGFDGLSEFFGEYDEARPVPPFGAEMQGGHKDRVSVGTVANGKGAPFDFTVENGVITDVSAPEG